MLRKKDTFEPKSEPTPIAPPQPSQVVRPAQRDSGGNPRSASSSGTVTNIGDQTQFVGDLTGNADLTIAGKFKGKVSLPKNKVTIDKTGVVEATIHANIISVKGKVEGQFNADTTFQVASSGYVKGDVKARNIILENECDFNGSIQMTKDSPSAESPQPTPQPPKSVGTQQPKPQKPEAS